MQKSKALLTAAFILFSTGAYAVDFSQPVTGDDGEPIKAQDSNKQEIPFTLGMAISKALFANLPGDEKASGEDKFRRGTLALKISTAAKSKENLELDNEEIAMVKETTGKAYTPFLITQIWNFVDPKSEVAVPKEETKDSSSDKPSRR